MTEFSRALRQLAGDYLAAGDVTQAALALYHAQMIELHESEGWKEGTDDGHLRTGR